MRIEGHLTEAGDVVVAAAYDDGSARPLAPLADFWADPRGHLAAARAGTGTAPAATARRVPPVPPDALVLCVGLNYRDHVAEGVVAAEPPDHPTVFGRWTRTLDVDGGSLRVPPGEPGLDWEGEVVAWIGEELRDADPDRARAAVVGYSVFNDVTARSAQRLTSQWTLGKNADGSGPLGAMVPADAVGDLRDGLRLRTRVNGEVVQDASTADLIFEVGEVLSLVSRTTTLRPGDLLATGTPAGVGYARTPPRFLVAGDVVEVEAERLGRVRTLLVH